MAALRTFDDRQKRSVLTDHQAYGVADQVYRYLGYTPARHMGKTEFGHMVANLVQEIQEFGPAVRPTSPPKADR